MTQDPAIRVQNLSKCYRIFNSPRARLAQSLWPGQRQFYQSFWALQNVSFELEAGCTLGVVGRNGSGKSTLLQLLCGTLTPTSGSVHCRGRIAALLELGSGFNPDFSGLENVYLNAALLGLTRQETEQRLDAILAFADIGEFVDQPVKTYSSGMAVRLAFAVQANIDPDVLVVDEALAVGDELFQRKCFKHLERLKSNGTSILLVTHSCPQIVQHCDQALLLHKGQLACIGKPKTITTVYQRLINSTTENWSQEAQQLFQRLENEADSSEANTDLTATAAFDPSLKPESTTNYPSRGLRIETISIHNDQGKRCNLLEQGHAFKITIDYFADEPLEHLELACSLTDKTGQVISGQRFPELGSGLPAIQAGESFRCTFSFQGLLPPGLYFVNAGAWNTPDRRYLHRIVDGSALRILPPARSCYSFGLVDLSLETPRLN